MLKQKLLENNSSTEDIELYQLNLIELADYINRLIISDFSKLVNLLYRIDVSEKKLKTILQEYPNKDAGMIIAQLIIERQQQKAASKVNFKQPSTDIPEDEKW